MSAKMMVRLGTINGS
ncbi:hypothetical protein MTR67_047542 [Solanum verrucosum]|uniref:Uncharacterized protein n=1 Tax=Solanum verrucosum TaxID=315347 RepID=A0AAF0UWU1_SOLVR|nr:hypothetical protein MTR67_047542 [Solanum verrucosum]